VADIEEKVAKLTKKLEKVDRKMDKAATGAEYNSLLIDRRAIESELWDLDPHADVAVH